MGDSGGSLIEARARAAYESNVGRPEKSSLNSDAISEPEKIRTDTELAKIAGVGKDTVRKVEKIKETAAPELLTAVRAGEVSIHAAADIATLAPERQAAVVASGSVSQAAKEIRAQRAEETRERLSRQRPTARTRLFGPLHIGPDCPTGRWWGSASGYPQRCPQLQLIESPVESIA